MNNKLNDGNQMKSPLHTFSIRLMMNGLTATIIGLLGALILISLILPDDAGVAAIAPFMVLCSILSLLALAAISYSVSWKIGQRDFNLVKYNHIELDMKKGLKAGILSQIPWVIFGIIATVMYYAGNTYAFVLYKLFVFPFWWLFMLHDMPYLFVVPLLLVPVMANWGYRYGYRFISLRAKIIYQNPEKSEKKKAKDKRLR